VRLSTRNQTEREIAQDNQREAALQEYIDKMSELLLEKDLRKSGMDAEVRTIAQPVEKHKIVDAKRMRLLATIPHMWRFATLFVTIGRRRYGMILLKKTEISLSR
jgi:hypothetical protein